MYRLKGGGWYNRADPIGPCAYAGVGPFRAGRVVVGGWGVAGGGGGGGGGGLVGCVRPRSRARRTRVSPSDDYPAGRLQ